MRVGADIESHNNFAMLKSKVEVKVFVLWIASLPTNSYYFYKSKYTRYLLVQFDKNKFPNSLIIEKRLRGVGGVLVCG